jgi:hypothetical protein
LTEWCRHCARADGALKTYEEVLAGMTNFLTRTQGLDEQGRPRRRGGNDGETACVEKGVIGHVASKRSSRGT